MTHKKHSHRRHQAKKGVKVSLKSSGKHHETVPDRLEIVLKCDLMGSQEAVRSAILQSKDIDPGIDIIHSDVGAVTKSDLQMALTGSRLVIGFNVDVMPKMGQISKEQGVEVRLYQVIYHLIKDLKEITANLLPPEEEERVTGEAKVIELFKSSRKGIILGCDVQKGILAEGNRFRVISAMGPVYTGKIESLHIGTKAVNQAKKGQQVGLKISDFKDAKIDDLVECFKSVQPDTSKMWRPRGGVFHCGPQ